MNLLEKYKSGIAQLLIITTISIFASNVAIAADYDELNTAEATTKPAVELELSESISVPSTLGNSMIQNSRFSLADYLNLRVEDQGYTNECWAFTVVKALETSIAIDSNTRDLKNFSERHMDYATSRTFRDGINQKGFKKEVGEGGLILEGLAYLTNGQGAVLESDMPFENNEVLMPLESIDKPVNTIVNDYYVFPSITKKYVYDENGNTANVSYYKTDGSEYTEQELKIVRNEIKNHLVTEGAISTMTVGTADKYYNRDRIFDSTAYNCNSEDLDRDHAFTIIGWDDNYSKENFAEGAKPSTDGAYIVLNSYGEHAFDNGFLYVSYEDFYIEDEIYGIQSTSNKNYSNLYQTDFYGGIYNIGREDTNTGYYGAIFTKDTEENETIRSIGVTLCSYANLEIYINPNGSSLEKRNLVKVGETAMLTPGYHRISIEPTKIFGNKFSVVIKQHSDDNRFFFAVETALEGTIYEDVTSDNNSYMSTDGEYWTNLTDVIVSGIDVDNTDVCLKVFTDFDETGDLSSDEYMIDNNYIYNIKFNTDVFDFLRNVRTNSSITELKEANETVTSGIIKTGMKFIVDNKEYVLIVRGDINADGNLTLTDLSKLILHYNENRGFELEGDNLRAADMNLDGKVSLVDVSQLVVLYNTL